MWLEKLGEFDDKCMSYGVSGFTVWQHTTFGWFLRAGAEFDVWLIAQLAARASRLQLCRLDVLPSIGARIA